MENVKIYNKLKFSKTSFNFKNNQDQKDFYNKMLLISPRKYVDTLVEENEERMHVAFSWSELFYYMCVIFTGISFLFGILFKFSEIYTVSMSVPIVLWFMSSIFGIMKLRYSRKYKNIVYSSMFTKSLYEMDNYSFLREDRKNLLNKIDASLN